mgnify:CR=1 FL=1
MPFKKTAHGFVCGRGAYRVQMIPYSGQTMRFVYTKKDELPPSTPAVIRRPAVVESEVDGKHLKVGRLIIEEQGQEKGFKIYDRRLNLLHEDLVVNPDVKYLKKKLLWEKAIYGNGEKYNWLNHLGSATFNYNSDVLFHNPIQHPQFQAMHTAIPFYLGVSNDKAYGLFFDNSSKSEFDFAKSDPASISMQASGGMLDYYFIYGPALEQILAEYCSLTGKTPLPPLRYLGYQQSRYSYENREQLLNIAKKIRKYNIPCDILYLDIHYMEDFKVFTVDRRRFSDFKDLIGLLKEMGFSVVVIVNPGVKVEKGYQVYEEGLAKGYFIKMPDQTVFEGEVWPKPAVFPDLLSSEVRRWWAGFHHELLEAGVDGIWNDMNEPANFTLPEGTLPAEALHINDAGEQIEHEEAHNMYGLFQTLATREALEKFNPERRHFVLTRAAFAGNQRYAAIWTGDNSSLWEHLEISIPMILNLGLSGYAFAGADVGGYRGDCSGELLVRWTQLGSMLPLFRNHSEINSASQEPWCYSEEVLQVVRRYIQLRYELLTYFYSLFWENTLTGAPLVRPLVYHYQDDPETYNIYDQFLLGPGLLACPVTRPGMSHRQVYLPAGQWYDYWTDEKHCGGRYMVTEALLNRLPLFVKAGSIIPLNNIDEPLNVESVREELTLHFYAGDEGRGKIYFDDGKTLDYLKGVYSELEVFHSGEPLNPQVEIRHLYKGYPTPQIKYQFHGFDGSNY